MSWAHVRTEISWILIVTHCCLLYQWHHLYTIVPYSKGSVHLYSRLLQTGQTELHLGWLACLHWSFPNTQSLSNKQEASAMRFCCCAVHSALLWPHKWNSSPLFFSCKTTRCALQVWSFLQAEMRDTWHMECCCCRGTVICEEPFWIGTARSSTDVYKYVNHVITCVRMCV